jgi:hypothetical protein
MQPIISTPKTFSIWHPNSISNNPSSNPDTPPHPPGVYSVYTAGLPRTVGGWRDILETVWSSNYYGLVRSHPPQGTHSEASPVHPRIRGRLSPSVLTIVTH